MAKILHITNGDSLTSRLQHLSFVGDIITWREILCEGPTHLSVLSEDFMNVRMEYLSSEYEAGKEIYKEFITQFSSLNAESYEVINLWFEYDLFCHINLSAVVHYLQSLNTKATIKLICSGRIDDTGRLYGLGEIDDELLMQHYDNRFRLSLSDIESLLQFWQIYNSEKHNELSEIIIDSERLLYLKECISAQLKRFPDKNCGLNFLEHSVLKSVADNEFASVRQLLGYMLRNQGYYGFGDLQLEKIISRLNGFINTENEILTLTSKGEAILTSELNAYNDLKNDDQFGGAGKYNYFYDSAVQNLIRINENS